MICNVTRLLRASVRRSGRDLGTPHHRVGHDRAHAGRFDCGRLLGVDGIDHERRAELGVRVRDPDARHFDAERRHEPVGRALHGRAADDGRHADDAFPPFDEHLADAGDREHGTDRDHRVRRADHDRVGLVQRVEHAGRRPGRIGAVEAHALYCRLAAFTDEPFLHREVAAVVGGDARAHPIVGHGQQLRVDAPRAHDLCGHGRERRARVQALRAKEMGGEIFVAEAEPRGHVVTRQRVERVERLAFESPALRDVRRAGEGVGDRVEVGGDVQSVKRVVVGGVDDCHDVGGRHDAHEPREKTSGAHTPGQSS
jgi:hypothetical protein